MANAETSFDALSIIEADMESGQRHRRAHFLPALVIAAVVVVASLGVMGARPDLLDQPPAQLLLLGGLWVLCLVVFPAIGVGLLFVNRTTAIMLVVTAVVGTLFAVSGWPLGVSGSMSAHMHDDMGMGMGMGGCFGVTAGSGVLLLGIGFLSGAFVQRRRSSAVFWVAAGVALVALNVVTWHCPESGMLHVLPHHMGAAAGLLALASVIGLVARRYQR